MVQGRYFHKENDYLSCVLCPHRCRIKDGKTGICKVRGNQGGDALLPYHGYISSLAVDPIEKKPLYHFKPGTAILSAGFWGCNLRCPFCQNWSISQTAIKSGQRLSPEDLIMRVQEAGLNSLAYTYSEPLVHFEYLMEAMKSAHTHGIANILVTNGCILDEPAQELLALTDGVNVDLKSFSTDTYRKVLGGELEAVLNFIRRAFSMKVHLEVTTLVVGDLNDSEDELDLCMDFLANLSKDIPWHISAYHPAYRWDAPATPSEFIQTIAKKAREHLSYVYLGNVAGEDSITTCPDCKAILVRRRGYQVDTTGLRYDGSYRCAACGVKVPISG